YDPSTGIWTVGTVDTSGPRTLRIRAVLLTPGATVNTATVSHADQFDPNTNNNTSTSATDALEADLSVAKTVSNPTPNVGDTITYTVTVTDDGPNNATGVVLQDVLPAGMNLVSATPSQGAYDPATGVWTIGGLTLGSSASLIIRAQVVGADPTTNEAEI